MTKGLQQILKLLDEIKAATGGGGGLSEAEVQALIDASAPSGGVIGTAAATISGGMIDPSTVDGVIASWVRNGAGDYTLAFTVAQPNVNYITHVTIEYASLAAVSVPSATKTVNDFRVLINDVDDTPADPAYIQITVSRLSQ